MEIILYAVIALVAGIGIDRFMLRKMFNTQEIQAKNKAKQFKALTIAYCLLPTAFFHRITFSARASRFGGIVRPICFAVFKLITISNLSTTSTRKSPG